MPAKGLQRGEGGASWGDMGQASPSWLHPSLSPGTPGSARAAFILPRVGQTERTDDTATFTGFP